MATEQNRSSSSKSQIKSIDEALKTLNESASNSSEKIQSLIESDYGELKAILTEAKPQVKGSFRDLKDASLESLQQASEEVREAAVQVRDEVDESVRKHPWYYIGGAAAVGGLLGYLWGRK